MTVSDVPTPRLVLKSTREQDADFCLKLWLDEEMGRYLADPPREMAQESYLNFAKGIEDEEGWYPFLAWHREEGVAVGTCSMVPMNAENTHWDLGYCVDKPYWRKGYATEMVRALLLWGRQRGGRAFTAKVARENTASNALLRKLGFQVLKEGSFRKQGTDLVYPDYTYVLRLEDEE